MKRILMAAAMLAVPAVASAASLPAATGSTATHSITLNGRVTAQCVATGTSSVNLPNSLAGADGFLAAATVQSDLLAQLNTTNTRAWCSGNSNKVVLSRTALVRNGSTGAVGGDGFANAVLYDVGVNITGAVNPGSSYTEGTSDGAGNGPVVGRFGPTGAGAAVTFVQDTYSSAKLVPEVVDASAGADGASNTFTTVPGVRLAAGDYSSVLTLTLTPGV